MSHYNATVSTYIRIWITIILFVSTISGFAYSPWSTPELDEMEQEFMHEINKSSLVIRNPLAIDYINRLGRKLAQTTDMQTPDFFLVKADEINAFAGPGGHIGVNSALILATDSESELAAVMAHELAHVRLHHLYNRIEHEQQKKIPLLGALLASAALGILNPALGTGAAMAAMSGFAEDSINFTRAREREADRVGIDMLMRAHFNPAGMTGFFEKMQQNSRYYYTQHIPAILRTHPMDDERIAEAQNRMRDYHGMTIENAEYNLVKEIIRVNTTKEQRRLLEYYQHGCKNRHHACQYGKALTLIRNGNYQEARDLLLPLTDTATPEHIYYDLALAEALGGLKDIASQKKILQELVSNYPENLAVVATHADALIANNDMAEAKKYLIRATRSFKQDYNMCKKLARLHAHLKDQGNAYFTEAKCALIHGQRKKALMELKVAEKFATKDPFLRAKIKAKIEELTS